jgi:hypothetical protein
MEGYGADIGVSPRAIAELLNQVNLLSKDWNYSLTLSMLEIYNETILDLLCSPSAGGAKDKLDVRQTPEGNQVVGLTEIAVKLLRNVEEPNLLTLSYSS